MVFPALSVLTLRMLRQAAEIHPWDYVANLLPPALSSGVMAAASWGALLVLEPQLPRIPLLIAVVGIGAISYAAVYWLVFRRVAQEILGAVRGEA